MADSAPTAHSILTSFLLTSTSYTLPSLSSLRSLDPHSRLSDSDLKQAHRDLLQHRKGLRDQLQQSINDYKLLPPGAAAKRTAKEELEEELEDEGAEWEQLTLQQVIERLEAEERLLDAEVGELQEAVEQQKEGLDAFADTLISTEKPAPTPPSVERELEATLGGLERNVKKYRGLVDEINEKASRS